MTPNREQGTPPVWGFNGAGDHSPDVTFPAPAIITIRASFNGAGDHSPDVTAPVPGWKVAASCFNGAGDHSPDVTYDKLAGVLVGVLQWGRGSLPGCDPQTFGLCMMQCFASMGPGITPRM